MLTKITRALNWADEKLENLLADLAANYARELLAAHGLFELEIDHIKRNSRVEPAVASIEGEKIDRSIASNENALPQIHLKVIRLEGAPYPTEEDESPRAPAPNCDPWSGPEVLAALCVAGAAIVALLFCLAAIFKS